MGQSAETGGPNGEYEPNFTFPHRDAIHEDNWAEYEAAGVKNIEPLVHEAHLDEALASAQINYGTANVYSGDAFDSKSGRPLRHMPGKGIYARQEGIDGHFRRIAERKARKAQASPDGDPEVS